MCKCLPLSLPLSPTVGVFEAFQPSSLHRPLRSISDEFFLQVRSSSFFNLKHFRVVQKIKIKTVDDKNHIANNRIGLKLVLWKAQLRNVSLKEKKRPFVVPILPFCLIDNDKLKSFASLVSRRNRSVSVKL